MLANLWYLEETLERLEVSIKCVELAWMLKEWRQNWNLLEFRSFNTYKNTIVLIIAILSCLGLDTEILDNSMKTTGSNEYREMLESDRVTNRY